MPNHFLCSCVVQLCPWRGPRVCNKWIITIINTRRKCKKKKRNIDSVILLKSMWCNFYYLYFFLQRALQFRSILSFSFLSSSSLRRSWQKQCQSLNNTHLSQNFLEVCLPPIFEIWHCELASSEQPLVALASMHYGRLEHKFGNNECTWKNPR